MKLLRIIFALLMICLAATASAKQVGKLVGGEHLLPGDLLLSSDGNYGLEMKVDGSIAMTRNTVYPAVEYWNPGVFGQELLFQYDGNLVLYDTGRQHAVWTVNKGIIPDQTTTLIVTVKGALQAFNQNGNVIWTTADDPGYKPPGTTCPGGVQSQPYPICVGGMNLIIPACSTQDAANYAHQQGGNYGACH